MFCPKCGNELVEGAAFCGKCGAKMPTTAATTPVRFVTSAAPAASAVATDTTAATAAASSEFHQTSAKPDTILANNKSSISNGKAIGFALFALLVVAALTVTFAFAKGLPEATNTFGMLVGKAPIAATFFYTGAALLLVMVALLAARPPFHAILGEKFRRAGRIGTVVFGAMFILAASALLVIFNFYTILGLATDTKIAISYTAEAYGALLPIAMICVIVAVALAMLTSRKPVPPTGTVFSAKEEA